MNISKWIRTAEKELSTTMIPSARLDSELLLCSILGQPRIYLHAHPEYLLSDDQLKKVNTLLARRLKREPLAYIFGKKEFYGRDFVVTPDVLIPRPESETIIDIVKKIISSIEDDQKTVIDVGTGSGALAITLALEFPHFITIATDIDPAALIVAQQNAYLLHAPVTFIKNNLLDTHKEIASADIIIANLPYVDKTWEVSPETVYEPDLALFADDNGLSLINELIPQADALLSQGGLLLLEADPRQHDHITLTAEANHYKLKMIQDFIIVLEKTA